MTIKTIVTIMKRGEYMRLGCKTGCKTGWKTGCKTGALRHPYKSQAADWRWILTHLISVTAGKIVSSNVPPTSFLVEFQAFCSYYTMFTAKKSPPVQLLRHIVQFTKSTTFYKKFEKMMKSCFFGNIQRIGGLWFDIRSDKRFANIWSGWTNKEIVWKF